MENNELANMIVSLVRDPDNLELLSIQEIGMDFGTGQDQSVTVLAMVNPDLTFSPLAIFCTPEVTERLKLDAIDPEQ